MLVATFGPDTAWAGRRITYEEGRFVLDGFGPVSAAQVLEFDAGTPLTWSTEGTRAWVRSRAAVERPQGARPQRAGTPSGAVAAVSAPPGAGAAAVAGVPTDAPHIAPQTPASPATGGADGAQPPAAAPPAVVVPPSPPPPAFCRFGRARYLGGHPGLGAPVQGTLWVTPEYIGIQGTDGAVVASLPMKDVAKVAVMAGPEGGSAAAQGARTRLSTVLSFNPGRAELAAGGAGEVQLAVASSSGEVARYGLAGADADAVRAALEPVLVGAGVPFAGGPVVSPAERRLDEVERLAAANADGSLTEAEYRAKLAPVLTAQPAVADGLPGAPAPMPPSAAEKAIARLTQLRLSGAITDEEYSAMKAKLLE